MRTLNTAGLDLIKSSEGFKSKPYLDAVSVPTIGYGVTHYTDGTKVTLDDKPITEEEASKLLNDLLDKEFCPQVAKLLSVNVTDNQFAALVSLAYNIGIGNFKQSTVLRCTNARNWHDASEAFKLWNKAGGIVLAGLTKRREAEAKLFLQP